MKSKAIRANAETGPRTAGEPLRRPPDEEIRGWIAEAAYYRAEKRGFLPGMEAEDWIAAEADVLARARGGRSLF
jgi:hypothetical protein